MSRPPGPVTSHLLRCELSFRMPSFPLRIPFWEAETKQAEDRMPLFHSPFCVVWCVGGSRTLTWSCLKSHKACTMTGLLLLSSGLRGFSLTMFLDLLTRLWTCLLFSMIRSFSFCKTTKKNPPNLCCYLSTAIIQGLEVYAHHKPESVHQTYWTIFHNHITQEQIAFSTKAVLFCSTPRYVSVPEGRTSDFISKKHGTTWARNKPNKGVSEDAVRFWP